MKDKKFKYIKFDPRTGKPIIASKKKPKKPQDTIIRNRVENQEYIDIPFDNDGNCSFIRWFDKICSAKYFKENNIDPEHVISHILTGKVDFNISEYSCYECGGRTEFFLCKSIEEKIKNPDFDKKMKKYESDLLEFEEYKKEKEIFLNLYQNWKRMEAERKAYIEKLADSMV